MTLRSTVIDKIRDGSFDVLVIGGGINGAVSAAVLAGRGADVALVDRDDFGGFTSQASSNLVWGGFKYLEGYEFLLVRKLCKSRNRLAKAYPDNVKPVGFLATLDNTSPHRPWVVALGALVYWVIGGFKTRSPRLLGAKRIEQLEPIVDTNEARGGLEYHDAYLADNDSRFVFSFVRSALDAGASAANYVEFLDAEFQDGRWLVRLRDVEQGGEPFTCTTRVLINAGGPFVDGMNEELGVDTGHRIVFSKGIHLIVPQITASNRVLAFYDDTQRLFYVIPMGRRSVIGTTDTRVDTPFTDVTEKDRSFLLDQINRRLDLDRPLTEADVIADRSGVRPLAVAIDHNVREEEDWTKLSRRHEVETDASRNVITIFGGKLTDCLNVGEEVAEAVEDLMIPLEPDTHSWYGEPVRATRDEFFRQARLMHLDDLRPDENLEPLSERLWRRYGRRAFVMLDEIRKDPKMGEDIIESADYLRVELHQAAATEMVTKLEDFLRRRSKITQVVSDEEILGSPGLGEAVEILFGDRAEEKLAEFLKERKVSA